MKRIIWAASARRDLARIEDWYSETAPDFGTSVGDKAVEAGRFLLEFPFAGGATDDDRFRKWPVPGTDFRILYRVTGNAIEIVRIRHAREDAEK